jgi:nickel/cobalt transporter (NicO) family protein
MRALRFVRAVCAMALLGAALLGGGHAYADVFGRPDSPLARHAQTDEHPLLLPGFVRDAVRVVIVAQARLDEAMQDDVLSLRSLGTGVGSGVGTGGDDAGDPAASRDAWTKLFAFVGLCLAYGVLHALAPGHGKTIAAMYFGSRAASAKQVAGFTLATALGQSLTAIVLVSAALAIFEGTANAIMRTAAPLELVSAIAVLGVATVTAVRILRRQECCAPVALFNAAADQSASDANANTDRAAYLGAKLAAQRRARPSFAAASDVAQPRRAGWLAFAVALRPCAGALFILLITARYHAYWLGIVAALAIGLGVAATVFTLGYALRSGRAITLKWVTGPKLERWQRGVALAGALVIAVFSALQIVLIVTGVSTMTPS